MARGTWHCFFWFIVPPKVIGFVVIAQLRIMNMHRILRFHAVAVALAALTGCVKPNALRITDPYRLTEPKNFTAHRSSSNNPDWSSNDDSKRPIPGETTVLADLPGPGVINHIWITIADNEYGWPRLLRLRIYYDGSAVPSVDAPIGDFFAVGHGFEGEVKSLMVRDSSAGRARNCYWPMPFRKSCKVTVTNEGHRRVTMLYFHVDWDKVPSLPARTPYFHARYRQALPAPADGSRYEFLKVQGKGHYVGTVMSVVQAEAGWFGEGDDYFWVDGQPPSIEGTGSEDYFNDAWGLHVNDGPYYGVTVAEGTGLGSRMTAYRWHLPDPIPFTKSLKAEIEHRGWTYNAAGEVKSAFGERTDLISSVAYWYQEGIAKDQPPLPYGSARLPQGNALQIEVEKSLPECKAERGNVSLAPDLFWSKDVILFEAKGKDSRIEVPFEVPEDGDFELYTEVAQGSDYGIYTVLLDGKPAQAQQLEHEPGADVRPQTQFDGYAIETYVGLAHQVGWVRLAKGRHTLTYVCLGKREASSGYNLGVDNIILARAGPEAWAAAAKVKEPQVPTGSVAELGQALTSDPDPITRGLAAVALRDQGPASLPVLPALLAGLKDSEMCVRMMSANAIAAIGREAASAVPVLIAAGSVKDEQVHVLRSVAAALGSIGKPAAAPALPLLRELAKIPRVQWSAEAAIRKIE
jgi:D-arabinan exo alpha-(1,3)/(1,5)-arabinofuranosidase (non-reducing end)